MRATTRMLMAAMALMMTIAACGGEAVTPASPTPPSSEQAAAAAATAYLEARTQALCRDTRAQALRRVCAPDGELADSVLWWAAGTRSSHRGREIGVPPEGYASASVKTMVRRVSVDAATGSARVLVYTTPGPGATRNVDSVSAFHLVELVRTPDGKWLAAHDTSTAYDPDVPVFLKAGGAPAPVVTAARADVRRAKHPGTPPAGVLTCLRAWCAATNARDGAALKATYTPDSAIQSMTDAQVVTAMKEGSPPNRRKWRIVGMSLLGVQLDGVACGWVDYRYLSDEAAGLPGSRGFEGFAYLERQGDGRWLIFSPPE